MADKLNANKEINVDNLTSYQKYVVESYYHISRYGLLKNHIIVTLFWDKMLFSITASILNLQFKHYYKRLWIIKSMQLFPHDVTCPKEIASRTLSLDYWYIQYSQERQPNLIDLWFLCTKQSNQMQSL